MASADELEFSQLAPADELEFSQLAVVLLSILRVFFVLSKNTLR